MEDSFEVISGLVFSVRDLIVDDERQQIFSRIEFTGTPVRPYAGVEPNGRPVRFAEHAIYWLDRGKIARVVTVIDWKSYREQLNP
jgi:predicted ester cyclase